MRVLYNTEWEGRRGGNWEEAGTRVRVIGPVGRQVGSVKLRYGIEWWSGIANRRRLSVSFRRRVRVQMPKLQTAKAESHSPPTPIDGPLEPTSSHAANCGTCDGQLEGPVPPPGTLLDARSSRPGQPARMPQPASSHPSSPRRHRKYSKTAAASTTPCVECSSARCRVLLAGYAKLLHTCRATWSRRVCGPGRERLSAATVTGRTPEPGPRASVRVCTVEFRVAAHRGALKTNTEYMDAAGKAAVRPSLAALAPHPQKNDRKGWRRRATARPAAAAAVNCGRGQMAGAGEGANGTVRSS